MNRIIIIIYILAGVNPNKIYLCINQNVLKLFLHYLCVQNMDAHSINTVFWGCLDGSVSRKHHSFNLRFVSSRHILSVEVLTKKYGLLRVEY